MSSGPASPDRLGHLLGLVDDVLNDRLEDARARSLSEELRSRLEDLGEELFGGVNSPRSDWGNDWDAARYDLYAPMEHVGAVHLELGSFNTFPEDRVRELVAGDGLGEFIRLDPDLQWDCEVYADARAMPFLAGSIDRVVSNSTLEHIPDTHQVLREAYRVLRPGGAFVAVMPFIWEEHGCPEDHVRLTRGFFERVLPQVGFVDIAVDRDATAGLYYTLHNAVKMGRLDESAPEYTAMAEIKALASALLGLLIPLDRFFEDGARSWFHSTRVVARKPGTYEPSRRQPDAHVPFAERAIDLLADPHTKAPLTRHGSRLVADNGVSYDVTKNGGVNFLEPKVPRVSNRERAHAALQRARGRARSSFR